MHHRRLCLFIVCVLLASAADVSAQKRSKKRSPDMHNSAQSAAQPVGAINVVEKGGAA